MQKRPVELIQTVNPPPAEVESVPVEDESEPGSGVGQQEERET